MPTATSTLSLNITAIQALCAGNQVLNGTTVPATSTGKTGDFYINSSSWVVYGPKSSTLYWSNSTSLIGPSGTNGALSATAALSALSIYNTTQTGLLVSSVGYSSALFSSDQQNVMSVYSAGSAVLLVNGNTSLFSASALQLGNAVTFTGPINNTANTFNISGNYVLIGASNNLYTSATFAAIASSTTLSGFTTIINSGQTAVASKLFTSSDYTGVYTGMATYNTTTGSNILFNFPLSTVLSNIAAAPATVTVNGSISAQQLTVNGNALVTGYTLMSYNTAGIGSRTITQMVNTMSASTNPTWSVPAISGSLGAMIYLKQRGTGTVTITGSVATDQFYLTAATTFLTLVSTTNGTGSYRLFNDGNYWNVM